MTVRPKRPVVLCILDGWGELPPSLNGGNRANAIARARTPVYDRLMRDCPHALLDTSGEAVGLPAGQMGNSEVGHMNLGGGRIVLQMLPRIDAAIAAGELARNPALLDLVARLRETGGACHLMGLVSPGGVHSHQNHMVALARRLAGEGVPVAVHAFLDGRDVPPKSALDFVRDFETGLAPLAEARIVTVSGRYFAMDRDKRWDRTERAYRAIVEAEGERAPNAGEAIEAAYARDETDEFVRPTVIDGYRGMADGDAILMANFRADRARQILAALVEPAFDGFARPRALSFAARVGMADYSDSLAARMTTLFPTEFLTGTLGELVAQAGKRQLRIAETEKYAHVTFFLNGGAETVFGGEDRILVPSPKVATYDLQPEMSAPEVTDRLVAAIGEGTYDFIVVNYANPDMVGHTGVMDAALAAVECIDRCLGRLEAAVTKAGGVLLITADHGNIELMRDPETREPHTAHTTFPVPAILVNGGAVSLADGRLCDVAPTLLGYLELAQPAQMTGRSLVREGRPGAATRASHATA